MHSRLFFACLCDMWRGGASARCSPAPLPDTVFVYSSDFKHFFTYATLGFSQTRCRLWIQCGVQCSAVYTWDYYPPYFNIHAPIANNRMLPGYKNIYCINYCASQAVPRRRESRAGPALSYYFSGLWMGRSCSLSSFRFNWMLIKSQHREPRDRLTAAILCWENNYFI